MTKDGHAHQLEFRVLRPDGQIRWCVGSAAATVDENNQVVRVSGVTFDITERKEAEERQTLLAREVDHRAKNALALVQSILRLTRAKDLPAYIAAVEGRIKALSRAHTVLSQSRWQGAHLNGLVEEELAPYRAGNSAKIKISGPDVLLQPAAAQTLALALHELATNAAKYGALSLISGGLQVSWIQKDDNLILDWAESGGPKTKPPTTTGFGTRIILASIEQQLRGNAEFDWRPDGLHCVLSVPLCNTMETLETFEPRTDAELANITENMGLTGGAIMLVEDEAIVALAVNDLLADLGFSVIGPFSRVSDAHQALQENRIDAAILDVNLGGEMVYSLAEILSTKNIPFVFATGYGAESIDTRFEHIPVLQKPIEKDMLHRMFLKSEIARAVIANGHSGTRAAIATPPAPGS